MKKTKPCPWCGQDYEENLESIDTLAPESREKYKELHLRFLIGGECHCPLCRALRKQNERENAIESIRRSIEWEKAGQSNEDE